MFANVFSRLLFPPQNRKTFPMAHLKRHLADLSSSGSESESEDSLPSIKNSKLERNESDEAVKVAKAVKAEKALKVKDETPKNPSDPITPSPAVVVVAAAPSHWTQGLYASMKDSSLLVSEDDAVVVIKDKYPKARHHYLIMPKDASLRSLHALSFPAHADIFRRLEERGRDLERKLAKKDPTARFRLGFHASPSMPPLHAHLISQDFDSSCLKNKKHWNSFTTDFFRDFSDVERELKAKGSIARWDSKRLEELLKRELRCHVCDKKFPNFPSLKEHIKSHS